MNRTTYATLRQILLDLGFQLQFVPGSHALFKHPPTGAWVLLRTYQDQDVVWPPNIADAGSILDSKGILPREQFDELLRERAAVG